jgi:hypothetical protein
MGEQGVTYQKLISFVEYIVVFRKTASQEAIDKQANEVNENGGEVTNRFSSSIMKVRSANH